MKLEFVDREITAYGGLAILKQMMTRSGFLDQLEHLPLPVQGSNRGYSPIQLFVQFMAGVWCGANRFSQLDITRMDTSIQRMFGWDKMPEHKASHRYFEKFDMANRKERKRATINISPVANRNILSLPSSQK